MKLFTILIAFGVAGAVFVGYTLPTYDKIEELRRQVAEFDSALDKARELQEIKRSLLARYNTFPEDQLVRLEKLLPDHVDNVRLVLDLDSLATQYRMGIQSVTISRDNTSIAAGTILGASSEREGVYDSLEMQFNTIATYPDFVRFLRDLETGLRIVDLIALRIERQSQSQAQGAVGNDLLYRYVVTLRTYWLK